MRLCLASLLALGIAACRNTGYILEDIEEGALGLVGQGPTLSDRLERLAETHDRSNPESWQLLPRTDDARPQRRALRELMLLEQAEYTRLGARAFVLMELAPYAVSSDSSLIRARVLRAVGALAAPFELNPEGKPLDASIDDRAKRHRAAARAYRAAPGDETHAALVAASRPLAALRLWPPPEPLRRPEMLLKRWKMARVLAYELEVATERDGPDIDGPGPVAVGLRSLVAEHARLLATYALIHDEEAIVRGDAVGALADMNAHDAVGVLAAASTQEIDGSVRRQITRALGRLGGGPDRQDQQEVVVPALIRLAGDIEDGVRQHAFASLRAVTDVDHGPDREAWSAWWESARADGASPEPRPGS